MNISTNDKGQQVISRTTAEGKVTWPQVITRLIDKTLFPKGVNNKNIDNRIFRDRADICASEMFNLLVFVKQRCIADLDQEIRRLELMRKDIQKDMNNEFWYWKKLPFKKELKECTFRIDGLCQAKEIVNDSGVEPKPEAAPKMEIKK